MMMMLIIITMMIIIMMVMLVIVRESKANSDFAKSALKYVNNFRSTGLVSFTASGLRALQIRDEVYRRLACFMSKGRPEHHSVWLR